MREESQDSMESYGINQDAQGGVMTGLWPSSPDPKSFPMPDVAARPISETEAFEDTVKSAYDSPFNLTNMAIRSAERGALYNPFQENQHGQEIYNQLQKQHKEWKANLQTDLQTLPTSDRHWYSTGWLPSMIGGLADPITMIAGGPLDKGIITGLAKLAPSASKLLAEKAGESAAKGIVIGAARGGAAGLATGATLGGAETLLNNADPDNDHVSLAQYAQNTFGWGFFGAIGGGVLGGLEYNKAANMVANAQSSLGKSIDTEANTVAALNEDRNNFTPDKQKTLSDEIDSLNQKRSDIENNINETIEQYNAIPNDEIQNLVHTTPATVHLEFQNSLNKAKDTYLSKPFIRFISDRQIKPRIALVDQKPRVKYLGETVVQKPRIVPVSQKPKLIYKAGQEKPKLVIPKPRYKYIEGVSKPRISLIAQKPRVKIVGEKIIKPRIQIKSAPDNARLGDMTGMADEFNTFLPKIAHFSKLKRLINRNSVDRTIKQDHFIRDLRSLKNESYLLKQRPSRISKANEAKLTDRLKAINKFVSLKKSDQVNPLATDILPKLKSHLDDLTTVSQDLRTKLAQQKYLMQPVDDLAPVARKVAENLGNDTAFSDPSTHGNMETQTDESAPYQTAPITDDEQDKVIEDLKNQGALLDSDYDELNRVNEAEEADKGKKFLFKQVISCLLKRGLDGR